MIGWDMICQPKEYYTQNLNVSKQLAVICLPMAQSGEEVDFSFSKRWSKARGWTDKVKMELGTQGAS